MDLHTEIPSDINTALRAAFLANIGFEVFEESSKHAEVGKLAATFGWKPPMTPGIDLTPEAAVELGCEAAAKVGRAFRAFGAAALVQITPITALRCADGSIEVHWDGCGVESDGSLVSVVKSGHGFKYVAAKASAA